MRLEANCPKCHERIDHLIESATTAVSANILAEEDDGSVYTEWENEHVGSDWENQTFRCPECFEPLGDITDEQAALDFFLAAREGLLSWDPEEEEARARNAHLERKVKQRIEGRDASESPE